MADETRPELAKLYRDAIGDGVKKDLAKWIFLEAKARGRMEIAERQIRRLESRQLAVESRAAGQLGEAMVMAVLANSVSVVEWHKAEQALSDAVEEVSACKAMVDVLSKSLPTTTSAPASRTAPSTSSSGRAATTHGPGATKGAAAYSASGTSSSNSSTRR